MANRYTLRLALGEMTADSGISTVICVSSIEVTIQNCCTKFNEIKAFIGLRHKKGALL